jgi:DNA polymerase-1
MEKRKLIMAIDFNNCVFASYYGQKLYNSKSQNINAIKGFFFKLKMLKESFNPDYIVFASDLSRERTFRRKLYKGYKAQRKPTDEDIVFQMKYVSQMVALLGYPILNNELYEADDILGMISKYGVDNNMDTIIISSDRDLYQLINDNTFIMSPRNSDVIDTAYIVEKYKLMPSQWIDLKILQGDNSDNIPGIPGIGEITALRLMQQYDSIEGIYSHMNEHRPSIQNLLQKGESSIDLTRQLVTIVTDYNLINMTEEMFKKDKEYNTEIMDILVDLEIHSLVNVFNYSLLENPLYIDTNKFFGSNETFEI